ncbi:FHA domain-containing protein [Hathewaya histolytica]|uniref:FHA-domain-containing protein n=1 Tax=Hathewaya histolytica TaxID=1498 RepID=A0A4U9R1Q1_HATHI|nr:FHA domain-containing protein [Hathewaya histolytica]VTQ83823.1 FHA-domain-containing protein [Hathewaya histolytica]
MGLENLSVIFKFVIIAVIYIIIFLALIIMYRDIKNPNTRKKQLSSKRKKSFGLEVINSGGNINLRPGSVIPVQSELTIGRKPDNLLVLNESYVSSYHAKVYFSNNSYIISDLNSTNGTYINDQKLEKERFLKAGDQIKIGSAIFKVIS